MQGFLLENSLWQFAVSFYQQTDNQQTLLCLQDEHDFSVNQLLFLLYVDAKHLALDKPTWQGILQQTEALQHSITSFRKQRLHIKQHQPALYSFAKQQELNLEQLQLALFYQHSLQLTPATPTTAKAWQLLHNSCEFNEKNAKLLQKLQQQIG